MWSAVQNAAQVTRVDALSLIVLIVRAAETARQNNKTCQELVEQVKQIGDLLRSLEEQPGVGMGIMCRPETSAPLRELHETLRLACAVVSHLDSMRLLVQVINSAAPTSAGVWYTIHVLIKLSCLKSIQNCKTMHKLWACSDKLELVIS